MSPSDTDTTGTPASIDARLSSLSWCSPMRPSAPYQLIRQTSARIAKPASAASRDASATQSAGTASTG